MSLLDHTLLIYKLLQGYANVREKGEVLYVGKAKNLKIGF